MKLDFEEMEDKIPYDLISKFLAGECSQKELKMLINWKNVKQEHVEIFEQLKLSWDQSTPPEYTADTEKALSKVSALLDDQPKKLPFARYIAVAASIMVALGLFFFQNNYRNEEIIISSLEKDKPQLHVLPDGSNITLNGGSSISYQKKFNGKERRITFSGEAYFDITSNPDKPFIIETGETETRVVGTEFNLRSTNDSLVQVYVIEGKVALSSVEINLNEVFIEPGEVGSYNKRTQTLKAEKSKNQNFLAWKTGKLSYENTFLKDALPEISQLYGIGITVNDSALNNTGFTASFDSMSVDELIQNLELILDVEAKQEGNNYVLK